MPMPLAMTGFSCVMYSCKISQKHASFFVPRNWEVVFRAVWWQTCLISISTAQVQGWVKLCRQQKPCFPLLLVHPAPAWCLPAPLPAACCSVFGLLVLEELQIHAFLWTSKALWLAVNASTYCPCLKIAPYHPLGLSLHSWCWFSFGFFFALMHAVTISHVFSVHRVVCKTTASSCLLPSALQEQPTCFLSCLKQRTRHWARSAMHLPKEIKSPWKCKKWTITQKRGNQVLSKNQTSLLQWTTGKQNKQSCKTRMVFWGGWGKKCVLFIEYVYSNCIFNVKTWTTSSSNMFLSEYRWTC